MLLDLESVPPEGQVIDRSVDSSAFRNDSLDFRIGDAASLKGRIDRGEGRAYRLSGRLDSRVELACVRCLEPFDVDVHEELDLLYLPQAKNVATDGENDHGLGDDELAVSFYRDDAIDLGHMVWEQIVLALPMKPICKSECRGLCPDCGTNLNAQQCACVRDNVDPRWQSLKSLLEP